MSPAARTIVLLSVVATLALWSAPPPASALDPAGAACTLTGLVSGALGKACTVATHAGRILNAGKKLLGGHVGGAIGAISGSSGVARTAAAAVGLAAIVTAVTGGARYLLDATARRIQETTTPNLTSTWFSASYWRMAAIAALLTLPFLFAAAIQAITRSDPGMLLRAAFGYLPLGMLAIGVAAPVTMLLLAASDEMSSLIASASGGAPAAFLTRAGVVAGVYSGLSASMFATFVVGVLAATATIGLWVELLTRQAAVYVIVLMLPMFFAALVWPARRIWAVRAVELLVALILSKFAIVAVLGLGGAALGHTLMPGLEAMLAGGSLVLLACFSPWALMRLLPLHELAGAAAGSLRSGARALPAAEATAAGLADVAELVVAARLESVAQTGPDPSAAAATPQSGARRPTDSGDGPVVAQLPDPGAPGAGSTPGAGSATGEASTPAGQARGPSGAAPDPEAPAQRLPGLGPEFQVRNWDWQETNLAGGDFDEPLIDPPAGGTGDAGGAGGADE